MCGALDTCAHVAGTALDSTPAFATCVCMCVFIYVGMYVCICMCVYVCVYMYVDSTPTFATCVRVYVGMYVCICMWIAHLPSPHVFPCIRVHV